MEIKLRAMEKRDWRAVASLICDSTNVWYQSRGRPPIFRDAAATMLFCEVYEDLDPGCCIVAEIAKSGRLAGSCFYHPRDTHVSLGIMNVHPDHFGHGVARQLLSAIVRFAESQNKPLRLVSSALNLDSFSLYTRAGFVPVRTFQDMYISVPAEGLPHPPSRDVGRIREARLDDVPAIVELELELAHISREKDYRYFIENKRGIWHASVMEDATGRLHAFLASVDHPGSNMLGPGIARTQEQAAAMILAELGHHRGRSPVFLVPSDCGKLVHTLYEYGARNCEIHLAQVRGRFEGFDGVVMPTFMPETA